MSKHARKMFQNKKVIAIILEYILAIECLLLIFILLKDKIETNTVVDKNGIRWSYSIENGYAENVCYQSGNLGTVVTIPETLNGYAVISIKGESTNQNIFHSYQNQNIKEVIIPKSVQYIGEDSFKNCTALEKIEIPDTVVTVGARAFEGCISLNNVTMSPNVITISDSLFNGCINLKEITISKDVFSIAKEAFQNCFALEKIELPEGLQSIGDNAFSYCYNLQDIELPKGIKMIGEGVFSYCKGITEITLPENLERIGYNTFLSCVNLTKINIGEKILSIGNGAFNNCINLKDITMPESVTAIGNQAFMNCTSLENMIIPKNVVAIEKATFYNCTNLKSINIGDKIEKIEIQAFAKCESLNHIKLSSNIKHIGEYAFYGCDSLESIEIDKNNPYYMIQDGVLYNKDKTELISCISNKQNEITILDTVLKIKEGAFRTNQYIKKIYLKANIQEIENFAFAECSKLTDIYLENKKENIILAPNWNVDTHNYFHDKDCTHMVEEQSQDGTQITNQVTQIKCGENHTFKVAGDIQDMKVRVVSEGEYQNSNKISEIITPNTEGVYTISEINRDKKIVLQNEDIAGGVIIRYMDTQGNEISEENQINGKIGEKYHTTSKYISGYKVLEDDNLKESGILKEELITITYQYQKIERTPIDLFENQDIEVYVIIILVTILANCVIYLIKDRKKD